MITIDKANQPKNITNTKSKTLLKKNKIKGSFINQTFHESTNIEATIQLPEINPFLFLQEINEYKHDQEKLKEAGSKILVCLNDIRFGLMNGELEEEHIKKLKKVLETNQHQFKYLELQNVIDDIILRSEVELAKIEINRKN